MEDHLQYVRPQHKPVYSLPLRRLMFRHGCYLFKPPPVCCAMWGDLSWCAYITEWRPRKLTAEQMFGP